MKKTKEMKGIIKAIEKYIKKYKGNVSFVMNIVAFDENYKSVVKNDTMRFAYGFKDVLLI